MAGSKGGRGGRGGAGTTVSTTAKTQAGNEIDLTENPLKYGSDDPAVTGTMRSNIEAWESKRITNKIEYGQLYKTDGTPLGAERRGGKSGVLFITRLYEQAQAWSHTHPRSGDEEGMLGGTFSKEDLIDFGKNAPPTARAATAEGTYSITRGAKFDETGFRSWLTSEYENPMKDHSTRMAQATVDCVNGKITYSEWEKAQIQSFNRALVETHNALLANQKKYGYFYTLEKRR